MVRITTRAHTSRRLGRYLPAAVLGILAVSTCGLLAQTVDIDHLATFGSKDGIHPPRFTNKRLAVAAMGASEHPYGLGFPVAVAVDRHDRVWIADSGTASIHIFDPQGGYREVRKVGATALVQPAGMVADPQGRIYAVDAALRNVFVFDEEGEFDRVLVKNSALLQAPGAIALSEDGRTVYVADPPRNVLVALNREGEVNATIQLTEDARDPIALATINNQIWVLGGLHHRVEIFSPAGKRRGDHRWDGIPIPTAFTFIPGERRFLVANPRLMIVEMFEERGRSIAAFGELGDGPNQQRRIEGLSVDQRGRIYVIDSHHGKVLVFGAREER